MHSLDPDAVIRLEVPDTLAASVTRALAGRTARDKEIDDLPHPRGPLWLSLVVHALRAYRKVRPARFRARAVCGRGATRALPARTRRCRRHRAETRAPLSA